LVYNSFTLTNFLKYNWPSIFWAAFILGICLMPGRDLPSVSIWEFDKIVHFGVYFLLAVLLYWGWEKQQIVRFLHQQAALKIVLICVAYGFAVEVLQEWLTTDRHFDLFDALANGLGGLVGGWLSERVK
jgi:VanZ family protein